MKLLLLFLLLELSLFASIGKISALNGKVIVDRQKQMLDTVIGFDLEEKDIVSTDEKSKVQITLNDGTVLSLGKNSKLDIYEYVFDEKQSNNSKAEFKFVEGTFKSITGAIGKVAPEKFKLETKSATIGIRGTIVVGNQEKIACTHGRIEVTSAGVTQVLNAGMMTYTEIGKAPTPPTKIEGNLLKEIEIDSGIKKEESTSTASTSTSKEKTSEEKTSEEKTTTNSEINSNSQLSDITQQNSNTTQTSTISNSFSDLTASIIDKIAQDTITKQVNSITASTNVNLTNIPFYSTIATLASKSNGEGYSLEDTITFSVLNDRTNVTIATYAPIGYINPSIILRKITSDNSGEYSYNNDSWTIANSYYNAILTQSLESGTYELSVLNIDNNSDNSSDNKIELYFTANSSLEFTDNHSITTYGYNESIENFSYISSPSIYANHAYIENNAKYKVLADSKVGTTISTDNGYFVTISDNFNSINYENNNSEPFLTDKMPPTNVFLDNTEYADGSSWGYWTTALNSEDTTSIDMKSVWVSGNQVTPAANYKATFQGQVIGNVTNGEVTGYIKLDSDNVFKATIDVGTAKITESLIKFTDTLSNSWSGTFDTTSTNATNVTQQGFSASITGTDTRGSLSGKYFGTNGAVKSIGGQFDMISNGSTANGVFKAR